MTLKKPEPLNKDHHLADFDSHYPELDPRKVEHRVKIITEHRAK